VLVAYLILLCTLLVPLGAAADLEEKEGRILCWNLDRREKEVVVRLHKLVANSFGEYDVMQARRGAVGDEYPIRAC